MALAPVYPLNCEQFLINIFISLVISYFKSESYAIIIESTLLSPGFPLNEKLFYYELKSSDKLIVKF